MSCNFLLHFINDDKPVQADLSCCALILLCTCCALILRLHVLIKSSCLPFRPSMAGTRCWMQTLLCDHSTRLHIKLFRHEGGFGLTPVSDTSLLAFYHASAHLIQVMGSMETPPVSAICGGTNNLLFSIAITLLPIQFLNFWMLRRGYLLMDACSLLTLVCILLELRPSYLLVKTWFLRGLKTMFSPASAASCC